MGSRRLSGDVVRLYAEDDSDDSDSPFFTPLLVRMSPGSSFLLWCHLANPN